VTGISCTKYIQVYNIRVCFCFNAAPPYWVEGGIKQFYVSKGCATRAKCEAVKTKTMPQCTYLWYQDWKCAECCLGDRCNYYVTVKTKDRFYYFYLGLTVLIYDVCFLTFRWEAVQ